MWVDVNDRRYGIVSSDQPGHAGRGFVSRFFVNTVEDIRFRYRFSDATTVFYPGIFYQYEIFGRQHDARFRADIVHVIELVARSDERYKVMDIICFTYYSLAYGNF